MNNEGEVTYRDGALVLPNETLVGGWSDVYRKDHSHPKHIEVNLQEYIVRTKEGKINDQWTKRPATMIRKVALVQALREAFPENLGALYVAEEVGGVEQEAAAMQEIIPVEDPEIVQPVQPVQPEMIIPQVEYSESLL